MRLKHTDQPVPSFRVLGVGGRRSRIDVAAHPPETAFVGRDAELAALLAALSFAERKGGRAVAICAEAGLGKSRLLFELRRKLDPTRSSRAPQSRTAIEIDVGRVAASSRLDPTSAASAAPAVSKGGEIRQKPKAQTHPPSLLQVGRGSYRRRRRVAQVAGLPRRQAARAPRRSWVGEGTGTARESNRARGLPPSQLSRRRKFCLRAGMLAHGGRDMIPGPPQMGLYYSHPRLRNASTSSRPQF